MTEQTDYASAVAQVRQHEKCSASWLQRQLAVGYNTAAHWLEQMQSEGIISPTDHLGRRIVLVNGATPPPPPELQIPIPVDLPEHHRPVDDRLRRLIERVERLKEERTGVSDDIRDVYLEAKAAGYDVKIMREIERLRKMAPDDRHEMEAILDLYKSALGLS